MTTTGPDNTADSPDRSSAEPVNARTKNGLSGADQPGFEQRRKYALIGGGVAAAGLIGLTGLGRLAAQDNSWTGRAEGAIVLIVSATVTLFLLRLIDGDQASLLLRTLTTSPSAVQSRRLATLIAFTSGNLLIAVGSLGVGVTVLGAAGDTLVPVQIPWISIGCLAIGNALKAWTRRQSVTIEARIAKLQRKFQDASNTVKRSQEGLKETQNALRELESEIERQAKGLAKQHAENQAFSQQLRADPDAAKAYLRAQAITRRKSNTLAFVLLLLGIAAGYLVNLTSDSLGSWLSELFS